MLDVLMMVSWGMGCCAWGCRGGWPCRAVCRAIGLSPRGSRGVPYPRPLRGADARGHGAGLRGSPLQRPPSRPPRLRRQRSPGPREVVAGRYVSISVGRKKLGD